jgi:hypothetical protein
VWTFFVSLQLDTAYAVGKSIWSVAPQGGFLDYGNDGMRFSNSGSSSFPAVKLLQDGTPVLDINITGSIVTLILTCSGSSVSVYLDGVLATDIAIGSTNPAAPPSSPWTLASTINIGCFIRGDGGNDDGVKGTFQSGGFKLGGTALTAPDIANLHSWMLDPV